MAPQPNFLTSRDNLLALILGASPDPGAFHAVYVVADVGLDARHEIGDSPGMPSLFQ